MRDARLESFKACNDYQLWIRSETSRLLVLSGYNHADTRSDHCWVSPVAMGLISDLPKQATGAAHAYYVFTQEDELVYHCLSIILLQLVRQRCSRLREQSQSDELRVALNKLQNLPDSTPSRFEYHKVAALQDVILRVMSLFAEADTAYVIIDRADRCCDLRRGIDHRKPLLETLVKMVEAARCRLKVLVVIKGWRWQVEKRKDGLGGTTEHKVIIHTAEQGYI